MRKRILSDKQRHWLQDELGDWREQGIVSQEQTDRILARYEDADEVSQRKRSRFTLAISGIAALLFGLAAFLVIGHNWSEMPRVAKLTVIFGVVIATHAGGLWLRFARDARRAGEVVTLLGCLFYGAGIWLVAQVFHLDAHWPDGFWWWALGVLPFALAGETLLIHCLYAGLLATWAGAEILGYRHLGAWLFWGWQVPNGAYSLLVLWLPAMAWAYRRRSAGAVSLYVPVLAWWITLQSFVWRFDWQAIYIIGAVGAVMLAIAENHRPGNRMAVPYRFWGTALAAGALVPMSFGGFYESTKYWYRHHAWASDPSAFAVGLAVLALIAIAFASVALFRSQAGDPSARVREMLRAQWLPLGLAFAVTFAGVWAAGHDFGNTKADTNWIPPTAAANIAMLALALWLMNVGLRDDRGRPFAFGVIYFLAWSVCRYADLFGKRGGMLGAALMFVLCGAALFGLARFWSHRKASRASEGRKDAGSESPASWPGPAWLDGAASWFASREHGLLPALAALQVAVLAGMIALHAAPLMFGETIRLKVQPVDPRDLMRGDFVILSYDISGVPKDGIEGIPDAKGVSRQYWDRDQWMEERTVYVTLEPDADGKLWRGAKTSIHPPASGKFIRGKYVRQWGAPRIQFGIEAFYVQEDAGKKLEEARNARRLIAEVALMSSGKAALRNVIVESWKR
ncbi:MAG: GDYXXLXY domain-containing protein [Verrucomicrobia bacterium]|nr:GDYXXLXY domain-containing protein [Verrucomicrobiota bacterium]